MDEAPASAGDMEPRATASEARPMESELRAAIRRARIADAERSGAIYDLRAAEVARLELLDESLAPIFRELPPDLDLFDHGIIPSDRPRLYVDIVAFVEMARDGRSYRFLLDTQEGRVAIGESADIAVIRRLVTEHVARRLLAREKALASAAYPTGMLSAQQVAPQADPLNAAIAATRAHPPAPRPRSFFWTGVFLLLAGLASGAGLLVAAVRAQGGVLSW